MARPYSTYKSACYLRDRNFSIGKGEHWNFYAKRRHDEGKFIDLFVWRPDVGFVAVQACNKHDLAKHRRNVAKNPEAALWLKSGGTVYLFDWRKVGAQGRRKLWQVRIEKGVLRDGGSRIRFYRVKGTGLDLPGAAPQRKPEPPQSRVETAEPSKAPLELETGIQVTSPEARRRRKRLMLKRQAELISVKKLAENKTV